MYYRIKVRVTRELKEKMKKIPVKWSDEIRAFIKNRVKHFEFFELIEAIEEIELRVEKRRLIIGSTELIREDRASKPAS